MVLTTTTQIKESPSIIDSSTVSVPFQNMENQLQRWQKSIEFLKKENKFFLGMLELSIQTAKGAQAVLLSDFQEKILNFEQTTLANFSEQLQELLSKVILKNEFSNFDELHVLQSELMQQWEELDVIFKGLKLIAFEKIESGISVRIY